MFASDQVLLDQAMLAAQIDEMVAVLGEGKIESVPYDTAWMARLAPHFPGRGFDEALDWVRQHQRADGSWGGEFLHYHDRFISTLASLITLRSCGTDAADDTRIQAGETFLWNEIGRLHFDADDTIGFPVLAVPLVQEALRLGLDIPNNIYHNVAIIEKKLNLLGSDPRYWRYTSMSFSLEAARAYFPDSTTVSSHDFMLANGSVGASPAATAAYLLHSRHNDDKMLNYLSDLVVRQGDGGSPDMNPVDIFEISWVLNQLRITGAITPDQPVVRQHLDFLWKNWSQETGISFSEYFPVPDLDDTAVVFSLLCWGGYPVDAGVFKAYEGDKHFYCYPGEANPSLSVNIRTLGALQMAAPTSQVEQWIDKISSMLRRYDLDHHLWFDKWHISPYYLTGAAICYTHNVIDDLLRSRLKWIIKTQMADGGWGYYKRSTIEETAYCLQALLYADQHLQRIDPATLDAAANYIQRGLVSGQRLPALYIGKCLYMPVHVVNSAIYGALYSYNTYKGL